MFEASLHHPLQLASYRILFAAYLLVSNQLPALRWIPGLPEDFRDPAPGLTSILPHPNAAVAAIVEVSLLLAVVGLMLGWRTRLMSVAVGVLGLVGSAMVFGFGKIDHTIFLWIIPLAMSSSAWGERASLDASGRPPIKATELTPTPAVPFLSVLLALAFLTAALPKFAGNWLSISESATRSYFLDKVRRGETNVSTSLLLDLESKALWEGADWATLVLEFGFAALVLWPTAYRLLAGVAALFHLIVLFVLNINFESSLVLYAVFFLQLLAVSDQQRQLGWLTARRRLVVLGGVSFIAAACAAQLFGDGLLRVALAPVGVQDWAVSLITQFTFSSLFVWLIIDRYRGIGLPERSARLRSLLATGRDNRS